MVDENARERGANSNRVRQKGEDTWKEIHQGRKKEKSDWKSNGAAELDDNGWY